jgi:probable rRNA maturation factor
MNLIEVQRIFLSESQPGDQDIQHWINAALGSIDHDTEIVVRIVGIEEMTQLNEQYRHKKGATNILSFTVEVPEGLELDLLGDLVICAPVVEKEASEQQKLLLHHWAHLLVHGVLHLLGYDHNDDKQAEVMETQEINILKKLNINNPYIQVEQQ